MAKGPHPYLIFLRIAVLQFLIFSGVSYTQTTTPLMAFRSLQNLHITGEEFTLAALETVATDSVTGKGEEKLAHELHERVIQWAAQRYVTEYGESLPSDFKETFLRSARDIRGDWGLLVIFEKDNPSKIYASLAFVGSASQEEPLPSEKQFKFFFPRQENEALFEIKHLVVARNAPFDFIPLLYQAAKLSGVSNKFLSVGGPGQAFPSPDIKRHKIAQHYTLTTHRRLAPYYRHLGFETIHEPQLPDNVIALRMNREKYFQELEKIMSQKRKGAHLLDQLKKADHREMDLLDSDSLAGKWNFSLFNNHSIPDRGCATGFSRLIFDKLPPALRDKISIRAIPSQVIED